MNFKARSLLVLTLILSFSAALAGNTADPGLLGVSSATISISASTTTSGK